MHWGASAAREHTPRGAVDPTRRWADPEITTQREDWYRCRCCTTTIRHRRLLCKTPLAPWRMGSVNSLGAMLLVVRALTPYAQPPGQMSSSVSRPWTA